MANKALIVTGNGFDDVELYYPLYRLAEAGWEVEVTAAETGTLKGIHGYTVRADLAFFDVNVAGYGLLLLPGGRAPQTVRKTKEALAWCGLSGNWAGRWLLSATGPRSLSRPAWSPAGG